MRVRRLELPDASPRAVGELAAEVRGLQRVPEGLEGDVARILSDVRTSGDAAVVELTRRFDSGAASTRYRVSQDEIDEALRSLDGHVREALEATVANVGRVAEAELRDPVEVALPQGQSVVLQDVPVGRAGAYVPGGRATYPSTVVMCTVPARVAGVAEVAVATPPGRDGKANPVVLGACALCGVSEVYLMGGAQAVAALAYGTETVPAVDVIVGPGSPFVQEAKRQLVGVVGIDGIEGPSELVVVADAGAEADVVTLDLAAQAEHGSDSLVALVSPTDDLLGEVARLAPELTSSRPTVSDAPLALVRVPDLDAAITLANAIAAEHLELACEEPKRLASAVRTSGCVFLGYAGGAAFGDYAAGSNHVLPTGGAARFAGPLGTTRFRRRQALVSLPPAAVRELAPLVGSIARAEGYVVHAESAEARAARVTAGEEEA